MTTLAIALVVSTAGVNPAVAQAEEGGTDSSKAVAAAVDQTALDAAVKAFDSGDADAVADLANVVAPEQNVPLGDDSGVDLGEDGELVLDAPGDGTASQVPSIGITVKDADGAARVIDGAAVNTEVGADLDVVSRATSTGAQVLSVLGSAEAPNVVSYDLDLPEGAELEQQEDGSVSVSASVATEVELLGEAARLQAAAEEILGQYEGSWESISDEDFEALAQIPEAETETVELVQQIGRIAKPWALDANGEPVATHYELDGSTLIQTIEITEDTAFPVVADPEWYWWAAKAGLCAASIAGFAFSAVKLPKIISQIGPTLKKTTKGKELLETLGGPRATLVKMLSLLTKKLPDALKKKLRGAGLVVNVTTKEAKLLKQLQAAFSGIISGVTGISRACLDMLVEV